MRVSMLVVISVVGIAMCQRVAFRDSMLGHMISGAVSSTRNGVGDVMDVFSTIGNGMMKVITPIGSRRKNRFRGQSGPGPQQQQLRRRPQKPFQQQLRQQQPDDGLQRLSGEDILNLATPPRRFRNRQQGFRQPQRPFN